MSACVAAENFKKLWRGLSLLVPLSTSHLAGRLHIRNREAPERGIRTVGVRMAAEPRGSMHIMCRDRGQLSWLQLAASQQENHEDDVTAAAAKRSARHPRSERSRSRFSEPPASGKEVRAAAFATVEQTEVQGVPNKSLRSSYSPEQN